MRGRRQFAGVIAAGLAFSAALAGPPADEGGDERSPGQEAQGPPVERIVLNEEVFKLELAADPAAREKGLMGRKTIADDGGMIFVFPDVRRRSFWMKDCLVDIDLVYLDRAGRIVSGHAMKAEPPRGPRESESAYERRLRSYVSRRPAQFAVELKAGTVKRLELRLGQRIELDRDRLVALARDSEPQRERP